MISLKATGCSITEEKLKKVDKMIEQTGNIIKNNNKWTAPLSREKDEFYDHKFDRLYNKKDR